MLFRSLNKVQLNAPLLLGFIYLACLTVVTTGYVESQISPEDHCSLDNILKNRLENCACKFAILMQHLHVYGHTPEETQQHTTHWEKPFVDKICRNRKNTAVWVYLGNCVVNNLLGRQVTFVTNQQPIHMLTCVALYLLKPLLYIVERLLPTSAQVQLQFLTINSSSKL